MEKFGSMMLKHVLRAENKRADTLANLATALTMRDESECKEMNVTLVYLIGE